MEAKMKQNLREIDETERVIRDMLIPTRSIRNARSLSREYHLNSEERFSSMLIATAWELTYLAVVGGLAYRAYELIR